MGNVCQKAWAQMAISIISFCLHEGQKAVLRCLSKVLHELFLKKYLSACRHLFAFRCSRSPTCEFYATHLSTERQRQLTECVPRNWLMLLMTHHMPHLLQRRKTHLLLYLIQCMNEFGQSFAFNAERYVCLRLVCLTIIISTIVG